MGTRTNIVFDDELIGKAMAKAGVSTKKAAIDTALRAYVREPDWQGLLALAGSGVLADDYDPAALFDHARARPMVSESPTAYNAKRRLPVNSAANPAKRPTQPATQPATKPAAAPRRK